MKWHCLNCTLYRSIWWGRYHEQRGGIYLYMLKEGSSWPLATPASATWPPRFEHRPSQIKVYVLKDTLYLPVQIPGLLISSALFVNLLAEPGNLRWCNPILYRDKKSPRSHENQRLVLSYGHTSVPGILIRNEPVKRQRKWKTINAPVQIRTSHLAKLSEAAPPCRHAPSKNAWSPSSEQEPTS